MAKMALSSGKKRIIWIDSLKGFAAILVVLGHDIIAWMDWQMIVLHEPFWNHVWNWIYSFDMMLFFFISGYLFYTAYCEGADSAVRRSKFRIQLLNLILIYFAYNILLWCGRFFLSAYLNKHFDIKDLLMIPIAPLEVYWYLWVLIVYYLIGWILFHLMRRHEKTRNEVWFFSALILSLSTGMISYPGILHSVAYYAIGFFSGPYLARKGINLIRKKGLILISSISAAIITLFIIFGGWKPQSFPFINVFTAMLLSIVFVNLFIGLEYRAINLLQSLAILGGYALEIYLLHEYFISAVRRVQKALGIPISSLGILVCTFLEVAGPVLFAWILKKLHIHKLFFRPVTWFQEKKI